MAKRRSKGDGGIEELPSGAFRAVLPLPNDPATGKRRRLAETFSRKTDAAQWLAERRAERGQGRLADPKGVTVAEWFGRWLPARKGEVQPRTYRQYGDIYAKSIKPHLGPARLAKLAPLDVRTWYGRLEDAGHSPAARFKAGTVLRMALKDAVAAGILNRNVAADVPRPGFSTPEFRTWTAAELRAFLTAARSDRLYALFAVAADTGARQGELFALHWRDVDWRACTIAIKRSLEDANGKMRLKDVKTKRGRRTLAVAPQTVLALAAHYQGDSEGVIFTDSDGGWLRSSNVHRRHWQPLMKAAGVPAIRFHDLRHTCATLLLQAGVNLKVVSERLGHADVVTTLRTYAHVMPGMQELAVVEMTRILG